MSPVSEIGRCPGCQRTQQLNNGACGRCVSWFGPNSGHIMARIRKEPGFAKLVYEHVPPGPKQEAFITMFGKTWTEETEINQKNPCTP